MDAEPRQGDDWLELPLELPRVESPREEQAEVGDGGEAPPPEVPDPGPERPSRTPQPDTDPRWLPAAMLAALVSLVSLKAALLAASGDPGLLIGVGIGGLFVLANVVVVRAGVLFLWRER